LGILSTVELCSRVKARHALDAYNLQSVVKGLLKQHLDKRIQHHLWETQRYTPRQLSYAATDALACFLVAKQLCDDAQSSTVLELSTVQVDAAELLDAGVDTYVDGDADAPTRTACSRTRQYRGRDHDSNYDGSDDESLVVEVDDGDDDEDLTKRADEAEAEARGRDAEPRDAEARDGEAEVPEVVMIAVKRMITDYKDERRVDDMELPTSLSASQRKEAHGYAEKVGLYHRSVGGEGDRRLVISGFRPLVLQTAAIGDDAVSALVAREPAPAPAPAGAPAPGARPRRELELAMG